MQIKGDQKNEREKRPTPNVIRRRKFVTSYISTLFIKLLRYGSPSVRTKTLSEFKK